MNSARVLGVYREKVFSPGRVEEDAAVLDATLAELSCSGYETSALEPKTLDKFPQRPVCVLSMAQSGQALQILQDWEKCGIRILNSVGSVRNCYRRTLIPLLAAARLPIPGGKMIPLNELEKGISLHRSTGYWLKRGDVHAMEPADVVKVTSEGEWMRAIDHFRCRGIGEVLVQEHVEGEVIKFYGVGGEQYFSAFLGSSGREVTWEMKQLQSIARQAAEAARLEIYGGDAIMNHRNEVVLIDLNDWPSFSRCCQPAAKGIARYVKSVLEGGFNEVPACY